MSTKCEASTESLKRQSSTQLNDRPLSTSVDQLERHRLDSSATLQDIRSSDVAAKVAALRAPARVKKAGGQADVVRALENRHRWLLFAQHCYTCSRREEECELGKLCTYGKKTLKHVAQCKKGDGECTYPRCSLLKPLLQHSRRCQSSTCAICVPVWNYIQKDMQQQAPPQPPAQPPQLPMAHPPIPPPQQQLQDGRSQPTSAPQQPAASTGAPAGPQPHGAGGPSSTPAHPNSAHTSRTALEPPTQIRSDGLVHDGNGGSTSGAQANHHAGAGTTPSGKAGSSAGHGTDAGGFASPLASPSNQAPQHQQQQGLPSAVGPVPVAVAFSPPNVAKAPGPHTAAATPPPAAASAPMPMTTPARAGGLQASAAAGSYPALMHSYPSSGAIATYFPHLIPHPSLSPGHGHPPPPGAAMPTHWLPLQSLMVPPPAPSSGNGGGGSGGNAHNGPGSAGAGVVPAANGAPLVNGGATAVGPAATVWAGGPVALYGMPPNAAVATASRPNGQTGTPVTAAAGLERYGHPYTITAAPGGGGAMPPGAYAPAPLLFWPAGAQPPTAASGGPSAAQVAAHLAPPFAVAAPGGVRINGVALPAATSGNGAHGLQAGLPGMPSAAAAAAMGQMGQMHPGQPLPPHALLGPPPMFAQQGLGPPGGGGDGGGGGGGSAAGGGGIPAELGNGASLWSYVLR